MLLLVKFLTLTRRTIQVQAPGSKKDESDILDHGRHGISLITWISYDLLDGV